MKPEKLNIIQYIILILAAIHIFTGMETSFSNEDPFSDWAVFARSNKKQELMKWMSCRMREELTGAVCKQNLEMQVPHFSGRFGIFITLTRGGRVRGCYGAFDHKTNSFPTILAEYLRGALRSDVRHDPVDISEFSEIKIIITIAERPFSINDINILDISEYGVMVADEKGQRIVYVPAEIKSIDYLKRTLLKKIRRVNQYFAFRAITLR